jgi:hypothetical protein
MCIKWIYKNISNDPRNTPVIHWNPKRKQEGSKSIRYHSACNESSNFMKQNSFWDVCRQPNDQHQGQWTHPQEPATVPSPKCNSHPFRFRTILILSCHLYPSLQSGIFVSDFSKTTLHALFPMRVKCHFNHVTDFINIMIFGGQQNYEAL